MATNSTRLRSTAPTCRLAAFETIWAERVVSWARDPREVYWLAPKTRPPLTVAELLRWREPGHDPYMLLNGGEPAPIAYGELNRLGLTGRQYWLGHLIVDPNERGRGFGLELTRQLLREAFERRGARRVTLVVFPDNQAAIECYRAAGMREDGYEWHTFPAYGRRECLLRFAAGPP